MPTTTQPTTDAFSVLMATDNRTDTITEAEARKALRAGADMIRLIAQAMERVKEDFGHHYKGGELTGDDELFYEYSRPEPVGLSIFYGACQVEECESYGEEMMRASTITEEQLEAQWRTKLLAVLKRGKAA